MRTATHAGMLCVILLASFVTTGTAWAATSTSTMAVSATVPAQCSVTASALAFGSYAASATDATASISVTCTNGTTYTVALDAGTGAGATTSARLMSGPSGATLSYNLYRDAARSLTWGNTIGTDVQSGTGNGTAQALTVYGRIPAAQYPIPGTYTDTVTVTVTY